MTHTQRECILCATSGKQNRCTVPRLLLTRLTYTPFIFGFNQFRIQSAAHDFVYRCVNNQFSNFLFFESSETAEIDWIEKKNRFINGSEQGIATNRHALTTNHLDRFEWNFNALLSTMLTKCVLVLLENRLRWTLLISEIHTLMHTNTKYFTHDTDSMYMLLTKGISTWIFFEIRELVPMSI